MPSVRMMAFVLVLAAAGYAMVQYTQSADALTRQSRPSTETVRLLVLVETHDTPENGRLLRNQLAREMDAEANAGR